METIDESAPIGAALVVGKRFTQDDFDEFARLSGDDNPIHVDPIFSAHTRFGRTVAHGMFLFGVLEAEAKRWPGRARVVDQRLRFSAPTFTDEDVAIRLAVIDHRDGVVHVSQRMVRPDGVETVEGAAILSDGFPDQHREQAVAAEAAPGFEGIRVGMRATAQRAFTAADVTEYRTLVGDNATVSDGVDEVPPALVGGEVSRLLGVELPGPGTNWLKQHYRFLRPLVIGEALTTSVEVTRLRPEKALVDLRVEAEVGGTPVMDGATLVLVSDLRPR